MSNGQGIELTHDPQFHRLEWRAARMAWAVLLALMSAMALGAFGEGPLSARSRANPAGLIRVDYQRILRAGSPTDLIVHVTSGADGVASIALGGELVQGLRITHIDPQPRTSIARAGSIEYLFDATAGDVATVTFTLQASRPGIVRGCVRSTNATVDIVHFVFP